MNNDFLANCILETAKNMQIPYKKETAVGKQDGFCKKFRLNKLSSTSIVEQK